MKYLLGLDNGGTLTKAALYTVEGQEIGVTSASTEAIQPKPGFVERDMEEMWQANCKVIRELLSVTGINGREIVGMAICGHGKGLYLWGKDGRPVRNGIISTDSRAYAYPLKWRQNGTEDAIFPITNQHIMACQPVSILAWLRDNEPESIGKIKWIFECKDYLRFRFTGEARAEITDYSGANVMNLRTRTYDDTALEKFGILDLKDALPPICQSTEICGYLTKEAADCTGLWEGMPVAGGMFDIDACMLAAQMTNEENVCMIAGSWGVNLYLSPSAVLDGSILMNSLYAFPQYYLIEESSPASASNLSWYISEMLPEYKDTCLKNGKDIYEEVNSLVGQLPADEHCPIFLPFLFGSHAHPNAKASFVGISSFHTRAHIARAIFEGVAFAHRYHLDRLLKARTSPVRAIRFTGGGAKSGVWSQMFADVMNLPVETVDANEMGTLGCAIAAATSLGIYETATEAASKMSRISARYTPISQNHQAYEEKYALYKATVEALDCVWPQFQQYIEGHSFS